MAIRLVMRRVHLIRESKYVVTFRLQNKSPGAIVLASSGIMCG